MRCSATMKEFQAGSRAQFGKLAKSNSSPAGCNRQGNFYCAAIAVAPPGGLLVSFLNPPGVSVPGGRPLVIPAASRKAFGQGTGRRSLLSTNDRGSWPQAMIYLSPGAPLFSRRNGESRIGTRHTADHRNNGGTCIRSSVPLTLPRKMARAPLFALSLCSLLLLAGCAWPGVDTHEKHPVYPTPADAYHPNQP